MKKYKKDDLESYTLGMTLTMELLNKRIELVKRIYIHTKLERNSTFEKIINICQKHNIEIIESDKTIKNLSDKENCYIIGVFQKFKENLDIDSNHVVLVNPSNTGNLGTIIRSCVGFGFNNLVIIKPAVDLFDPRVIRSSMGAIFNINYIYFDNFNDYYKKMTNREFFPFMLKAKTNLKNIKIPNKYSLIFGPEASGLDDSYLSIGTPLIIRHSNNIDSLNLDNAVSIALYEFSKDNFK